MNDHTIFPAVLRRERLMLQNRVPVPAVLDTDTFNEMDDQFALTFALLSPEVLDLKAMTAAPFFNELSSGPGDGMEKSHAEILRILQLLGRPPELAFRGSARYLSDRHTPVASPAAQRIVQLAHECAARGEILHILAIAALTNVASALLLDPQIAAHCTVVWLGGHPAYWPNQDEFNYKQDIPAAQAVFDSGVPLIQIPCIHGAETLITTLPELAERCAPHGRIGAYLYKIAQRFMNCEESRIIWDISTVGLFVAPEAFTTELMPKPIIANDGTLHTQPEQPEYRFVRRILRDPVFSALFRKIASADQF